MKYDIIIENGTIIDPLRNIEKEAGKEAHDPRTYSKV